MEKEKRRKRQLGIWGLRILLLSALLFLYPMDSQAAKTDKYGTFTGKAPDTYSISGDTLYFYPKKIYYSGNKIVCYAYVVNKTGHKIKGLSDVTLTLRNKKKKTVAQYTFKKKRNITIANNKYKTIKYIFPKSSVKMKKFYFKNAKRMSIRASFTYYLP
ncbi:MAG: SLAP domain-containing protein [Lachnospiraceae bacterium]|nr:SLAP domain-containing protein [Lachnospiraceae bacterium]